MEKFDLKKHACRPWPEAFAFAEVLKQNSVGWHVDKFTILHKPGSKELKGIHFVAHGITHAGNVYITVNGLDMFDVFVCDKNNVILNKDTCYLMHLFSTIEAAIRVKS